MDTYILYGNLPYPKEELYSYVFEENILIVNDKYIFPIVKTNTIEMRIKLLQTIQKASKCVWNIYRAGLILQCCASYYSLYPELTFSLTHLTSYMSQEKIVEYKSVLYKCSEIEK